MPFTLAHPVAVLPLRRRGLVFSALVVGSMAPDFEYFFGFTHTISHTFPGIVTFTLPLATAVLFLFHYVIKWPLISLLPPELQARVVGPASGFQWRSMRRLLAIVGSLAIGIATHILWDSFTHVDSPVVARWAALQQVVQVPLYHPLPMWKFLQLSGSVAGMLLLAVCIVVWYRRAVPADVAVRPAFSPAVKWGIIAAMAGSALALGYVNGADWYGRLLAGGSHRFRVVAGFAMTSTMVAAVEMFGFGLIWKMFLARGVSQQSLQVRRESGEYSPIRRRSQ